MFFISLNIFREAKVKFCRTKVKRYSQLLIFWSYDPSRDLYKGVEKAVKNKMLNS